MENNFHSVTLDKDKCKGCTNCIKQCPTEAIRVKKGKAKIIRERCVDCGICIGVCPHNAKKAMIDDFSNIFEYKYRIALPAPSLYGQFRQKFSINYILNALTSIGFHEVFEVAKGAEIITSLTKKELKNDNIKKPVISSSCPAVIKLIQLRFPELIDNILRLDAPIDVIAKLTREKVMSEQNLKREDIGIFFISPCAAKYTSIKSPIGNDFSEVDGAISISEIVQMILKNTDRIKITKNYDIAGFGGVNWANSGGESGSLKVENILAVDGIHNVIKILNEIENDRIEDIDFIETMSCFGGCIGGPLNFENLYVAKANLNSQLVELKKKKFKMSQEELNSIEEKVRWTKKLKPNTNLKLNEDIKIAIKKMDEMNDILIRLPQLDCGACGAPTCRALAEDIVKGFGNENDCIFILREKVKELAIEMMELQGKLPPVMGKE